MSSGNISFSWESNENVLWECELEIDNTLSTVNCSNASWEGYNLKEGVYSLEIRATDQAGNIANRAHAFETDQTPPITTIIQKPSPLSNQQISTLTFTCNEESCSFECQLNSTASQGSASSCNRGMFVTPILQHSAEYTFIVTATDQVGNRGECTTYTWETDFQSPLIFGVDNTTVQCSMATPEHTGFARAEDDKSENISVMYGDINLGCSIKRTWTAVDEAGNAGFLVQNIDLEFLPTLSLSPQVALPCDSTSSSAQVPTSTASAPNPCDLPIQLTHTDSVHEYMCPDNFVRN